MSTRTFEHMLIAAALACAAANAAADSYRDEVAPAEARKSSRSGKAPGRRSGSRRTMRSTGVSASASCRCTRPPRAATSTVGTRRPRARSRSWCCSTSSRATRFAARRACTRPTRPHAGSRTQRSPPGHDRAVARGFAEVLLSAVRALRRSGRPGTRRRALRPPRRARPASRRCTTATSCGASAASRIATRSSAGRRRRRKRSTSRTAATRADPPRSWKVARPSP